MSYYVMSTQYSGEYYLDSVAKYDDEKWSISGVVTLIDNMRAEVPTGRLLIIPKWIGRWLYENHEAFKPVQNID